MLTTRDRAAVIEMAATSATTAHIARTLRLHRDTVRRIRNAASHPAGPGGRVQPLSLEQAWTARTRPVDGGHLEWTGGRHHRGGVLVMRYMGKEYTAARIAYRIQHGTYPVGRAVPACGKKHCVAPAHLVDTVAKHRPTPGARYASAEQKLAALTRLLDSGHTQWTGTIQRDGTLGLPWQNRRLQPARVAFAAHYGREPQGRVTVACGTPHCLTGSHLDDALTRAAHRAAYAALGL